MSLGKLGKWLTYLQYKHNCRLIAVILTAIITSCMLYWLAFTGATFSFILNPPFVSFKKN